MRYVKVLTVFLSIVFFQIILTTDSNATTCTKSSGIFDISDIPNNGEGCEDQPNLYEVILYEGWLCTSASAASTFPSTSSVADLSNCFKIFENIKGDSETLGGFLLEQIGFFPKKNFKLKLKGIEFKVVEVNRKRIKNVMVTIKEW